MGSDDASGGSTRWMCTDGSPLIVLPAAKRNAWHGSFLSGEDGDFVIETPSGPFAFRCDYDFENPRSDYERACGIDGLVGELDVDGASCLVIGDMALETAWCPGPDGGMLVRRWTVEQGADIEAELALALRHAGPWSDEALELPGGEYLLMDALDLGFQPEREPVTMHLPDGRHRISTADVTTGDVAWVCIRIAR